MPGAKPLPIFDIKHAFVKNTETSHSSKPPDTGLCLTRNQTPPSNKQIFSIRAASSPASTGGGKLLRLEPREGCDQTGSTDSPGTRAPVSRAAPFRGTAAGLQGETSALRLALQSALARIGRCAGSGGIGGWTLAVRLGRFGRRLEIGLVALGLLVLGEG